MTATTLNDFSMFQARGPLPDSLTGRKPKLKKRWTPKSIPFGDISVPERPRLPKGSVAPIL